MIVITARRALALALLAGAACGKSGDDAQSSEQAGAPAAASGAPESTATAPAAAGEWKGPYELRGSIEGNRPVSGALALEALASGAPAYAATRERVRRTYPSYDGPFYTGRLSLAGGAGGAGADTLRGEFTCANSPAMPPALVCHPTTPLTGLEDATLVVQPGGRAVLTGSHGEGVSVEFGRFSWTERGS
jgi:hypothetical protein